MSLPVFADFDTGIDDALALIFLLASADANLVGLAATAGNVGVDQVCRNNLGLLQVCGQPGVPVSRGTEQPLATPLRTAEDSHGPTGLGYAQLVQPAGQGPTEYDAAEAWVRAARARPGALVGVATGPLTNLALALRTEPALPSLLGRLVIVGGRNTAVDPEATVEVYTAWGRAVQANAIGVEKLPLLCGPDVTERAVLTPDRLRELVDASASAANPVLNVLENAVRFRFEVNAERGVGNLVYLHDPVAVAVALDPGLMKTRLAAVDVSPTGSPEPGRTTPFWDQTPNARVGIDLDAATFLQRFLDRMVRFAGRPGHS